MGKWAKLWHSKEHYSEKYGRHTDSYRRSSESPTRTEKVAHNPVQEWKDVHNVVKTENGGKD